MNWKNVTVWAVLSLVFFIPGFALAFYNWVTVAVAFLLFLPATVLSMWLVVYQKRWSVRLGGFLLWLVAVSAWLAFMNPYIAALFENLPGDTFE